MSVVKRNARYMTPMNVAYATGAYVTNKALNYATRKAVDKAMNYAVSGKAMSKSSANKGGASPLKGRNMKKRGRKKIRAPSKQKIGKELSSLKRQVKDLKHAENASLGKITYRRRLCWAVKASANQQGVATLPTNGTNEYELVLAQLKYYDPAVPGTLVTADGTSGTYQKDFLFKNIYGKLHMRNNYQTDCEVIVYLCKPKADTSQSPSQAWTDGIADDPGNITSYSNYGSLPTDYDTARQFWSYKRMATKSLSPGQSLEVSHAVNDVEYNPAFTDTHNLQYQRGLKHFQWLIIVRGTISHDSAVATEQGISEAGIDVISTDVYECHYDAGVNLSFVYHDHTLDTFTNGAVQSHQPVADNIGYSIA